MFYIISFSINFLFKYSACTVAKNQFESLKILETKKITNCKAELDNGTYIDLSTLDNPSDPLYNLFFFY